MAVVLQTDDNSYFQASALRRSHSQPKFGTKRASFHSSSSTSLISEAYNHHRHHQQYNEQPPVRVLSDSALPSEPSSPRTSYSPSTKIASAVAGAPAFPLRSRGHSLEEGRARFSLSQFDDEEDEYFSQEEEEDLEPPPSPRTGDSYSDSPHDTNDNDTSTEDASHPDTPDFYEHADDDTAVRAQPSRHVDYLSHNWREEDIWESWKYIVSRKADYSNAARLENASWRTWMKSKNKLRTVSPETLNWMKDCDVTWLYGPLQTGFNSLAPPSRAESVEANLPKSPSTIKKPILKKRSMSEVMLQRSLSTSSLVKQAAAAVQAQQKETGKRLARPKLERAATDYVTFPLASRRHSPPTSSLAASTTSSGLESPAGERKHIHFNEQVEQCIAVDIKGDDDDDYDSYRYQGYDSDSDNEGIMMKRTSIKKKRPLLRRNKSSEKTIAMLPSTTLKYRDDTPEPPESATAMKHSYRSPDLTPSSSQETLRPSKPSEKLFVADDDGEDEDDDEEDEPLSLSLQSPRSPSGTFRDAHSESESGLGSGSGSGSGSGAGLASASGPGSGFGLKRTTSSSSLSAEPTGMRRTESGMFMPYEEGDPPAPNGGFVGRVIDTVNTARDIAHVIWNVGWRK